MPLILLGAAGLLLGPRAASAQIVIADAPKAAGRTLLGWFYGHVPVRFRARERFVVYPLGDADMGDYLRAHDTDGGGSSHADDGEIDGVFEDRPPRITLRLPEAGGKPDLDTFAHEYGHYVWFHLLSPADRDRYRALYDRQKDAHRLVSRYAETNVEEGFAEAFSRYVNAPASLRARDKDSSDFLRAWPRTP